MAKYDRFSKQILLKEIGQKGQEKIFTAKILIIGLGGLGSPAVRYLASAGVGNLGIIDDDIIEIDNLARQNNYFLEDIDSPKAEVTAELLRKINPEIKLQVINKRANRELLEKIIGDYDLVIDASDNFKTKFLISDLCLEYRKTHISASFLGFKGYLSVYKAATEPSKPCFRCFHQNDSEINHEKACFNQGVFSPALGVVGSSIAAETIKEILALESLAGNIMIYDFLQNKHRITKLNKNQSCTCNNHENML